MFQILTAAVREFITAGEPVSSELLFRRHDFGIRPAMIRAELSHLTDEGYLEQPHHSAGRVPTNRGYEFFAEQVMENKKPYSTRDKLAGLLADGELEDFISSLAGELGLAAAIGTADGEVIKEGLEPLMKHTVWNSREEMLQIIRDFEAIEDRLVSFRSKMAAQNFLDVFIGRKSPVTQSDELAVMAGDYEADGERIILFAIGPKRMNYEKTAAVLKGLKKTLNT